MKLGVHEFLVKPISPKTLQQRLLGILLKPRPMIRAGRYYIPMPRRRSEMKELMAAASMEHQADADEAAAKMAAA